MRFVKVKHCAQDWHAVRGGADVRDRGLAAELRERLKTDTMDVPKDLRSPYDPHKFSKLKYYLNSIVHENNDMPTRSIELKWKDQYHTYPYTPEQTEDLLAWAYQYQNNPKYLNPSWRRS